MSEQPQTGLLQQRIMPCDSIYTIYTDDIGHNTSLTKRKENSTSGQLSSLHAYSLSCFKNDVKREGQKMVYSKRDYDII